MYDSIPLFPIQKGDDEFLSSLFCLFPEGTPLKRATFQNIYVRQNALGQWLIPEVGFSLFQRLTQRNCVVFWRVLFC